MNKLFARIRLGLCLAVVSVIVVAPAAAKEPASIFQGRKPGEKVGLTRAPYLQSLTPTSVYIVWNTDKASSTILEYRWATGTGKAATAQIKSLAYGKKVGRHAVKLEGLQPNTAYYYTAGSNGRALYSSSFKTADTDTQTYSFAVWGDSGAGSTAQKKLAAQIERARPDFLVHTGDLIYDKGEQKNYNPYFFNVYRKTLARVPFYGSLGNHDVQTKDGQPFLDNFILPRNGPAKVTPERNYSFDYGSAHFVVIDTNQSEKFLRETVAPWVERDMKASQKAWKFAVFHHPPYSSGDHGDDARVLRALVPTFSKLKLDAVFNGHDHHYERFKKINGVVYIVTGAGGAGRYKRREKRATTAVFYNDDWSFTRISIKGRALTGSQINTMGKAVDTWKLTK